MVRKSMGKKLPQPSSSESSEEDDDEEDGEGQRSTDSSSSSGSGSSFYERSPSPFSDGLDDQLMGDEEDQKKLGLMNERDREIEMFKRCVLVVLHSLPPTLSLTSSLSFSLDLRSEKLSRRGLR